MSAAARLLGLRVRIQPVSWLSVSCKCCILSRRILYDRPIPRPEECYRLWCFCEWFRNINNGTALEHWDCCAKKIVAYFSVLFNRRHSWSLDTNWVLAIKLSFNYLYSVRDILSLVRGYRITCKTPADIHLGYCMLISLYEQTADLLSYYKTDGRTSKWTGLENVTGEL